MQRHEMINMLFEKYRYLGVSKKGIATLIDRGLNRGYKETFVLYGFEQMMKKNYFRDQYHGNDARDERLYAQDEEFRAILHDREPVMWA